MVICFGTWDNAGPLQFDSCKIAGIERKVCREMLPPVCENAQSFALLSSTLETEGLYLMFFQFPVFQLNTNETVTKFKTILICFKGGLSCHGCWRLLWVVDPLCDKLGVNWFVFFVSHVHTILRSKNENCGPSHMVLYKYFPFSL